MDNELWRWIWLAAAVVFAVGEMASPGSFFLLPFALGGVVAAVLAFADAPGVAQWAAFVGVSLVAFAGLRPLARRLDREGATEGIGSRRLIGETGVVLDEIPAGTHELGMVRIHREQWRAESVDGSTIPAGVTVRVADVRGTRLIVQQVGQLTT